MWARIHPHIHVGMCLLEHALSSALCWTLRVQRWTSQGPSHLEDLTKWGETGLQKVSAQYKAPYNQCKKGVWYPDNIETSYGAKLRLFRDKMHKNLEKEYMYPPPGFL